MPGVYTKGSRIPFDALGWCFIALTRLAYFCIADSDFQHPNLRGCEPLLKIALRVDDEITVKRAKKSAWSLLRLIRGPTKSLICESRRAEERVHPGWSPLSSGVPKQALSVGKLRKGQTCDTSSNNTSSNNIPGSSCS